MAKIIDFSEIEIKRIHDCELGSFIERYRKAEESSKYLVVAAETDKNSRYLVYLGGDPNLSIGELVKVDSSNMNELVSVRPGEIVWDLDTQKIGLGFDGIEKNNKHQLGCITVDEDRQCYLNVCLKGNEELAPTRAAFGPSFCQMSLESNKIYQITRTVNDKHFNVKSWKLYLENETKEDKSRTEETNEDKPRTEIARFDHK